MLFQREVGAGGVLVAAEVGIRHIQAERIGLGLEEVDIRWVHRYY